MSAVTCHLSAARYQSGARVPEVPIATLLVAHSARAINSARRQTEIRLVLVLRRGGKGNEGGSIGFCELGLYRVENESNKKNRFSITAGKYRNAWTDHK